MVKTLESKRSIKIKIYLASSLLTLTLVALLFPSGAGFAQVAQPSLVAAGEWHSLALKPDGTVWAWGYNGWGQLGDGTFTNRKTPVQVSGLTGIVAVVAGQHHSIALKSDGTVWAWGNNSNGQLGDGTFNFRQTPVQVSGLIGVVAIATGFQSHSLAVKSDGTVWAWGSNANGQLGNGTTTGSPIPIPVLGLTNAVAVGAGERHSLALKSDGTVWAWGANFYGNLGDGTTTGRLTPVQVSGLASVASIAAGGLHSLALKSDGTVRAWGNNSEGQLGDGTLTNRLTPVQVSGLASVASIAGGAFHSLALKSDGTVRAWGHNNSGALGDGTTTNRLTPVQVSGLTGVAAIGAGAGAYHSLASKSDDTVWAWGSNVLGQLGDGTTTNRLTPVQVLFPTPDTTPPSAPSNLTANAVSATQINLSWTASTDNVGVVGYNVERCQGVGCSSFVEIAALGNVTTFSDTGLAPSTNYSYRVRARDAVPNFSGYSIIASATTFAPPDTTAPDTIIDSAIDGNNNPVSNGGSTNSTSIIFAFSGTDNVTPAGSLTFECSLDGAAFTVCVSPKTYGGLTFGTHNFQVRAKDQTGNLDPTPAVFAWTIAQPDGDSDGVVDAIDNCPATPNPDQANNDADGSQVANPTTDAQLEVGGDACDVDDDNDKIHDSVDTQPLVFSRCADDMTGTFPGTYTSCSGQTSGTSGGTTFAETQTAPFGNIRIKDALDALKGLSLTGLAASVKVKICNSQFVVTLNNGQNFTGTCSSLTAIADSQNIGDISIKFGPPLTPNATPAVNTKLLPGQEVKLVDLAGDPAIITPASNTLNIETAVLAELGTGVSNTEQDELYHWTQTPDSEVHVVQNPDGSTTVSVVRGSAIVTAANSTTVNLSAGQSVRMNVYGNVHGQVQENKSCQALKDAQAKHPQDTGLPTAIDKNC